MATKTKSRNKYFQPNPTKNDNVGDCVVRAVCKATGQDWDTVFKGLFEIALEKKMMPNSDEVWQQYLIQRGFKYNKLTIRKGSKRPTVQGFATDNKKGLYVLRVANHIVTCEDGHYYDTWDCGDRSMYGYWDKK